jgi:hypothetical protein
VAVTIIVLLLDRRGKKRRGSMGWQAEQEKQKTAGGASALQHVLHTPRYIEIMAP